MPASLRKEHPCLLLERGGPGMQRCLIGQRDLWSLRVAIPTCLWFPASRGVKCRVELVPRGGSGARGNPRLCQPGRRPSASAGGTAGLPGTPHHPDAAPRNFAARRGPAGGHGPGAGGARTSRSLSAVGFGEPEPRDGHRRRTLCPTAHPHRSIPAQNFPLLAAGSGAGGTALPGAAAARSGSGSAGLHRAPMPAGSLRAERFDPPPGIARCSEELGGCLEAGRGCGWVSPRRWELEP